MCEECQMPTPLPGRLCRLLGWPQPAGMMSQMPATVMEAPGPLVCMLPSRRTHRERCKHTEMQTTKKEIDMREIERHRKRKMETRQRGQLHITGSNLNGLQDTDHTRAHSRAQKLCPDVCSQPAHVTHSRIHARLHTLIQD